MNIHRALALAASLAAPVVLAASAVADAPWSVPAAVDGVASTTTLLTTQLGGRVLVGGSSRRSPAPPTVVARLRSDGSTAHEQTLPIDFATAAAYARAGIVVAGSRPVLAPNTAAQAPVLVAVGSVRGRDGIGAPRALPGSAGQRVLAVGGNPANGVIAVVTGSMYNAGAPTRTVWLRNGGSFRRALTFPAGTYARDAAVAVGARGDVLVTWQAHRTIYARRFDPAGRPKAVQRLGAGVQSSLQARIDDDGRLEVAWQSQRVSEGFAATPATVSFTSAPPGGRFAPAHVVGGSSLTGIGRYVMRPGVRLVGTGPDTSALAWTDFDGTRFRVKVADVTAGIVGRAQAVSPADDDAVLGDLAFSPAGGQLVLWLTGTRGNDSSGPQRVAAAVRPPGARAFGAPVLVSPPGTPTPFAPSGAVDSRTGERFASWTTLDRQTQVAVRPAG